MPKYDLLIVLVSGTFIRAEAQTLEEIAETLKGFPSENIMSVEFVRV